MKTKFPSVESVIREWYVIDAKGQTLGRMATKVASMLRGKHKAIFAPHVDTGDFVIVINAKEINATGRKMEQKLYWHYTGFPGGERAIGLKGQLDKHPERVVELAVKGMLPKGPLGRRMFSKLKVYASPEHPHKAQNPKILSL